MQTAVVHRSCMTAKWLARTESASTAATTVLSVSMRLKQLAHLVCLVLARDPMACSPATHFPPSRCTPHPLSPALQISSSRFSSFLHFSFFCPFFRISTSFHKLITLSMLTNSWCATCGTRPCCVETTSSHSQGTCINDQHKHGNAKPSNEVQL